MVLNRKTDWNILFDLFQRKNLSIDDLLMGPDFFQIARNKQQKIFWYYIF